MQSHFRYLFFNTFPMVQRKPNLEHVDSSNFFPKFQGVRVRKEPWATSFQKQTNFSNYDVFMMICQSYKATILTLSTS
jgi:hypothetical protein